MNKTIGIVNTTKKTFGKMNILQVLVRFSKKCHDIYQKIQKIVDFKKMLITNLYYCWNKK